MQQLQTGKQECVKYFIACSYNADCVGSWLYVNSLIMTFILNNYLMHCPVQSSLILQYTLLIKEKYIKRKYKNRNKFYSKWSSEERM